MLAVVAALAACTGALADSNPAPVPVISQNSNFRAMPCLGAGRGFAGLLTSAVSVKNATGMGVRSMSVSVQAGVLFVYQPNDTAQASYIGVQQISKSLSVPVGTASLDIPVSIPVVGSNGSASAVATTATVTFTQTSKGQYAGDVALA